MIIAIGLLTYYGIGFNLMYPGMNEGRFFGFGLSQLWVQLYGTLAVGLFTFVFAFGTLYVLKITIGIRMTEEEELKGLDIEEHDMEAYSESVDQRAFNYAIK